MKTILVVDDEYALVENLIELFEGEGYRVVSAGNGEDGLTRLLETRPDLVLTDFMMPIANGAELVRRARAHPEVCAVPIVMMTATERSVALTGAGLEVQGFLKKPFSWEALLRTVIGLIGPVDGGGARGA